MALITNPDFAAESEEFKRACEALSATRRPTVRPVLVLGGYHSPSLPVTLLASGLRRYSDLPRDRVLTVAYPLAMSIPGAVSHTLRQIRRRGWEKQEIDIIGHSMGGVVGRALLMHPEAPRAARLFTLATPHRGAVLAERVRPDAAARDLRSGSAFLESLDRALAGRPYELICYATLRDWWVGARNTAPAGIDPIWLDADRFGKGFMAHFMINTDRRILADLAMRLRGEPGFARASPPPMN